MVTRLVSGKVTYLHRRLWVDFLSVATSRDDWQIHGLSRGGKALLKMVDVQGQVRTDQTNAKYRSDEIHELESRLLVSSEEFHTERGSHAKLLTTWSRKDTREVVSSPGEKHKPLVH